MAPICSKIFLVYKITRRTCEILISLSAATGFLYRAMDCILTAELSHFKVENHSKGFQVANNYKI